MKNIYLVAILIIFLFINFNMNAQQATWLWVKQAGGSDWDISNSIACDQNNNIYVTGFFSGNAMFSDTMLISYGDTDIFIAKYDSIGNLIWVKKAGGSLEDVGNSITSDGDNNVYITGYFEGNANFGDTSLSSERAVIFLAKYDETGKCIWVKQPGGGVTSYTNYVASDSEGNMYIAADFGGNAIFEDTVFTVEYLNNIFIAKYDINGNYLWVKYIKGLLPNNPITIDQENNIYLTVRYEGTITIGDTLITTLEWGSFCIAKIDKDGNFLWVVDPGLCFAKESYSITTDKKNNIYVTGCFDGNATFDDTTVTSNGEWDIFISKYDSKGNYKWILTAGGEKSDIGETVICDSMRNVYITGGSLSDNFIFGDTSLTGNKNFIVKYDSIGNFIWADQYEGHVSSITSDNNNIYVTGFYYPNAYFGDIALTSYGKTDILVAKLTETAIQVRADQYNINQAIKLYPNPNNGIVYLEIKSPCADGLLMEFINITGELIYKKEYKSIAFPIIDQIDLSQYPKGIYFVRFRSKNHIQVEKLILQ